MDFKRTRWTSIPPWPTVAVKGRDGLVDCRSAPLAACLTSQQHSRLIDGDEKYFVHREGVVAVLVVSGILQPHHMCNLLAAAAITLRERLPLVSFLDFSMPVNNATLP